MTLGICEGLWLKFLLQDLGYSPNKPIQLYCNNKSECDMAHNHVHHDRTKHLEVENVFIKEKLEENILELKELRSED